MKIKVFSKGRGNSYVAEGTYDGKGIIIHKGSRISKSVSGKIQPVVLKYRNDRSVVSEDFLLLTDISFRSPSTAASFVSGSISNGMIKWRDENGITLKDLKETHHG